jgi:hypothetical protein
VHQLIAEDGVGHEPLDGRDELVARFLDGRGGHVGALGHDDVGGQGAVRMLVRDVEEFLAVVGEQAVPRTR